jgi:GT2 family glycosyltransferase
VAVSALVVNYQVYEDLQACLCALEAFLSDDDEVLVVDNASDPSNSRSSRRRILESGFFRNTTTSGFPQA